MFRMCVSYVVIRPPRYCKTFSHSLNDHCLEGKYHSALYKSFLALSQ